MIDQHIPISIVQSVLQRFQIESATAMAPGMSGAMVFRCRSRSGESYALKKLPIGTKRSRVTEVHRILQIVRSNGCSLVPRIQQCDDQTCWESHDLLWELHEWLPGTAITSPPFDQPVLDQIQSGAAAIRSFHSAAAGLGVQQGIPPAIINRLTRTEQLQRELPEAFSRAGEISGQMGELVKAAASKLQLNWNAVGPEIVRSLSPYADQKMEVQFVLRDVHREHILFDGDQASGLVDFDAVRIDTPLTDLARWAGSFTSHHNTSRNENQLVWNAAMAGFFDHSPFKTGLEREQQVQLAKHLSWSGSWISLANWLIWVAVERRRFPAGETAVSRRIQELLQTTGLRQGK